MKQERLFFLFICKKTKLFSRFLLCSPPQNSPPPIPLSTPKLICPKGMAGHWFSGSNNDSEGKGWMLLTIRVLLAKKMQRKGFGVNHPSIKLEMPTDCFGLFYFSVMKNRSFHSTSTVVL